MTEELISELAQALKLLSKLKYPVKARNLYFMLAPEVSRLKIGFSKSPVDRFPSMHTNSPVDLELRGVLFGLGFLERPLQELFNDCRVRGEWFQLDIPEARPLLRFLEELFDGEEHGSVEEKQGKGWGESSKG